MSKIIFGRWLERNKAAGLAVPLVAGRMVWASEKGMYNPVRRQEDLVCILDALCMRDDDILASSEGALLTEFVDSQAHKLNRGEFLVFMKDLYSRIETLLNGWVPSTQSPSLKSGDCCLHATQTPFGLRF